ncbi:EAL domain-containing protein [Altererythrobacter xixiisoli]|uniref:EAL domain-containing protein n=1 Tax=Croceibacterium xixiisoli TaxID=1476466 RepID=A0A6I4TSE6_9SPHN|nr:EAL domain-containing protein [Croceibacterium xixiisoli]
MHGDDRDERVRRKLVATLYTQPTSLAIGALSGIACCGTAMVIMQNLAMSITTVALILVAFLRVSSAFWLARPAGSNSNTQTLEYLYEAGAFVYAFLSGLAAAITIAFYNPGPVQTLVVSYAVVYGTGIAARNAGRPHIAIGQLLLTMVPLIVVCLAVGGIVLYVLGVSLILVIFAMASVTFNVFASLREQIMAAEEAEGMADRMRDLAQTDVVTGLANRAGLNNCLSDMLAALSPDRKLAMFWIDLDKFKEVNDTLGHPVGDKVLADVAARLKSHSPANAVIARFGGDEFIVVAEVVSRAEAERLALTISENISRTARIDEHRIVTTASMGVALLPDDGESVDLLMQGADLALYHAKAAGRNQSCFFNNEMTRELVRRKEIEAELRAAIQRDELSIYFQPLHDLETGRIRSFEALVRWFHPVKGELPPDEFIPVAEETGVIITLGNWITAQAARVCAQWPDDITVAVNLSPVQLRAPGAELGIINALKEANLDPRRLELEVTESLFIEHDENSARFIRALTEAGCTFTLDDFGTGYSSLGYINKFPFRKIKIDRSFVSGPDVGRKSNAIIRAVAEMGAALDMDIVAEGLETIEQIEKVRAAGCTLGQGYHYSRPVPEHKATELLVRDQGEHPLARKAG